MTGNPNKINKNMETTENKYVAVAYELYTTGEDGVTELVEKAPVEHPTGAFSTSSVTPSSPVV